MDLKKLYIGYYCNLNLFEMKRKKIDFKNGRLERWNIGKLKFHFSIIPSFQGLILIDIIMKILHNG